MRFLFSSERRETCGEVVELFGKCINHYKGIITDIPVNKCLSERMSCSEVYLVGIYVSRSVKGIVL